MSDEKLVLRVEKPGGMVLIEMEAILSEFRDTSLNGCDDEYDGAMAYQLKCIEDDIPFLGFFDSIYSHRHPFQLTRGT